MSRESMSRGFARQFTRRVGSSSARSWAIGALALGLGCSEDEGLTYGKDIRPLFVDCTTCHQPGAPYGPSTPSGVDALNAYAATDGLVVAKNKWKAGHPEIDSPVNNVTPGDPEDSFVVDKIAEPPLAASVGAGSPMPYQPPRLTDAEIASLQTWIQAGATQSAQFLAEVLPIIGNSGRFAGQPLTDGKCQYCHYANTPNPPDLTDPFGPNGLVNVAVSYRSGAVRVVPGNPTDSFLMTKVQATEASSEYGAPMPRRFERLTGLQVDRVRQWIEEGAKP
ncbi:MAG TPA: hypothetical protein VJU61_28735 [Polyangiaceae bacterium]|nr:hypothetical protein [Polyangiaceae bacterium]